MSDNASYVWKYGGMPGSLGMHQCLRWTLKHQAMLGHFMQRLGDAGKFQRLLGNNSGDDQKCGGVSGNGKSGSRCLKN